MLKINVENTPYQNQKHTNIDWSQQYTWQEMFGKRWTDDGKKKGGGGINHF